MRSDRPRRRLSAPALAASALASAFTCALLASCGAPTAQCLDGYRPSNGACVDVNECTNTDTNLPSHDCTAASTCINTVGSFECRGRTGGIDCLEPPDGPTPPYALCGSFVATSPLVPPGGASPTFRLRGHLVGTPTATPPSPSMPSPAWDGTLHGGGYALRWETP